MSSAACQTASICGQVVFWGEVLNANRINPTVVQIVESWRDACEYANPTLSKALPGSSPGSGSSRRGTLEIWTR
jgi:hypothetical protein